jgi:hypothetical protein
LPVIVSPIGKKIKPIDIKKANFMRGDSFNAINKPIERPYWLQFRTSGDNSQQVLVFSGYNYTEKELTGSNSLIFKELKVFDGFYEIDILLEDDIGNSIQEIL